MHLRSRTALSRASGIIAILLQFNAKTHTADPACAKNTVERCAAQRTPGPIGAPPSHWLVQSGLANVENIAAIAGVDVVHVGCNHLLSDMGKPGAFGDPEIVDAIERVIAVCALYGTMP